MKTTELIVEPFIGGALLLAAILFTAWTWFPSEVAKALGNPQALLATSDKHSGVPWGPIAAVVLAATAYCVGIIAENFSRAIFEGGMRGVKLQRFMEFSEQNPDVFQKTATLDGIPKPGSAHRPGKRSKRWLRKIGIGVWAGKSTPGLEDVERILGLMRFSIIGRNQNLSKEVESHVARMRLVRILAVVQFVFLIGLVRFAARPFAWIAIGLTFLFLCCTFRAIWDRFHRYCRAIERSYLVLAEPEWRPKP
jgi:hypothetical protein